MIVERVLNIATTASGNKEIRVEVEDSGPGIDQDKATQIFEAFVTTKPRGTGLGLAISKMIIERHGGELSAGRGTKGGARFRTELPIKSACC